MSTRSRSAVPPKASEPPPRAGTETQQVRGSRHPLVWTALCGALALGLLAPAAAVAMPIAAAESRATPSTPSEIAAADASGVTIPNLDDVRGNLSLPSVGGYGSALAWTSSDTVVIATDGVVAG